MAYSVMLLLEYKKITKHCGDNTNKSKTNRVSATRNVVPRWVHDIMEGNDVMKMCVCVRARVCASACVCMRSDSRPHILHDAGVS